MLGEHLRAIAGTCGLRRVRARMHAMIVSWRKLAAFWILCACSFLTVTLCFRPYMQAIKNFGDNESYASVARALISWHFEGLHVLQFWGLPYTVALVSLLGHVPITAALILVSAGSSAAVTIIAGRLWGWYVAAFATAVSFDWMQRSMLGGSEPLFLLLVFTAFLSVRREHWLLAALLASLATIVRPLGICALIAIGLVLLYRKEYRRFCLALGTGLLVGILYILPLHFYLHDGLATVHSYETTRPLFGVPFHAILQGLFVPRPLTNLALSCAWVIFIIAGIVLLCFSKACREFRNEHPVEFLFAVIYTVMTTCYNYPHWALGSFARFTIPVVPLALIAYRQFFVSRNLNGSLMLRRIDPIVWTSAIVFPVLAACSAYGIHNLFR